MPPRFAYLVSWFGRPRAGHLAMACGVFAGLVLAAVMTWYVVTSRHRVILDAVREMGNNALMLSDEQDRLLEAADVVQLGLIRHMREMGIDSPEQFEQLMASREVQENLKDRISGLPNIGALSLSDRHGRILNSSRSWPPPSPAEDSDRDFIRELSVADSPQTVISAPSRSKFTDYWIFHLSHRFQATDGRLIGFVDSTIRIDYSERFFARLPLTGGDAYSSAFPARRRPDRRGIRISMR